MDRIEVIFDNKKVTFIDNGRVVAEGSDKRYHAMGNNVANTPGYDKVEDFQGHKRKVVLTRCVQS